MGSVAAAYTANGTNYNSFYYLALLNNAAGGCIFDRTNYNITDIAAFTEGTTQNFDDQDVLSTGIICNVESAFLLNHRAYPPILIFVYQF